MDSLLPAKCFPLNLVGELPERMTTIHQMLPFDAKQIALRVGVRGGLGVHDLARV